MLRKTRMKKNTTTNLCSTDLFGNERLWRRSLVPDKRKSKNNKQKKFRLKIRKVFYFVSEIRMQTIKRSFNMRRQQCYTMLANQRDNCTFQKSKMQTTYAWQHPMLPILMRTHSRCTYIFNTIQLNLMTEQLHFVHKSLFCCCCSTKIKLRSNEVY